VLTRKKLGLTAPRALVVSIEPGAALLYTGLFCMLRVTFRNMKKKKKKRD